MGQLKSINRSIFTPTLKLLKFVEVKVLDFEVLIFLVKCEIYMKASCYECEWRNERTSRCDVCPNIAGRSTS